MRLLLINGPNLNILGQREPSLYGSKTLVQIEQELLAKAESEGIELECFQSNFEGALVERIHKSIGLVDGILINAGAYTHTSIAIRDALVGSSIPYVEFHLSNTHAREDFRHKSYLSDRAIGVIGGFGETSYHLALVGLLDYLRRND